MIAEYSGVPNSTLREWVLGFYVGRAPRTVELYVDGWETKLL